MPSLTLAQIREEFTAETATDELIDLLDTLGFSASSWQSGSVQRTMVQMSGYVYFALRSYVAGISYLAFNETSEGDSLTAFSASHYDNDRILATCAQHTCTLTGGAVGPPYTIAIDEVVASDGTRTFRNKTGGTIPAGGTLTGVRFDAEVAGTDGNVSVGTITSLVTPYAGVTITNTVLAVAGVDEETDAALRLRNSAKWSTLSVVEAIADRYEYVARTVLSNCRVSVDSTNPNGPGTLDVYLATSTGVASGANVTTVQTSINAEAFGGVATVVAAAAQAVAVTGTVYYASGYTAGAIQTAVEAAIAVFINAAPIGGYDYTPGPSAIIDRDGLEAAIRAVTGVSKLTLTVPAADVAVAAYSVATVGVLTITYTQITA